MIDCPVQDYLGDIPKTVMEAIVSVESSNNPFAIGVVGDRLVRQPKSLDEAMSTVKKLERLGKNYSVGLAQLNKGNFQRFNVRDVADAFDKCTNVALGARVLVDCFDRSDKDLGKALSCYYSGNFSTGFEHGYVQKVLQKLSAATPKPSAAPTKASPFSFFSFKSSSPMVPRMAEKASASKPDDYSASKKGGADSAFVF
jgi:type IV secretion system protein VirB1